MRIAPEPEKRPQVEETEGESFMQYMLPPENNYDNSIYRQGPIYKLLGYDMGNYGVLRRYSRPRHFQALIPRQHPPFGFAMIILKGPDYNFFPIALKKV